MVASFIAYVICAILGFFGLAVLAAMFTKHCPVENRLNFFVISLILMFGAYIAARLAGI